MVVGAEKLGAGYAVERGRLADHALGQAPAAAVARRAAAALERRARRHVADRAAARRFATRSSATTSASATGSTSSPGSPAGRRSTAAPTLPWAERIELDLWYVEHRSRARRPEDPAPDAARALRRHLQGRDGWLEACRVARRLARSPRSARSSSSLGAWNVRALPAGHGLRRRRPHRVRRRARPGRALPARRSASTTPRRATTSLAGLGRLGRGEARRRRAASRRAGAQRPLPARDGAARRGGSRASSGPAATGSRSARPRSSRFVPVDGRRPRRCSTPRRCRSSSRRSRSGSACARSPTARYAWALGVALGAAQLVRAFGLWTVARGRDRARSPGAAGASSRSSLVLAAVIPAPWYIHQQQTVRPAVAFNAAGVQEAAARDGGRSSFYVDPGLPAVVTAPYRPHFLNRALPTTYSELWGDYFGVWAWEGASARRRRRRAPPSSSSSRSSASCRRCSRSSAGSRSCSRRCAARRGSPSRCCRCSASLGYLYFAVTYPTPDGDVLKATYMLDDRGRLGARVRLRPRPAPRPAVAGRRWRCSALCALAELPFLLYG